MRPLQPNKETPSYSVVNGVRTETVLTACRHILRVHELPLAEPHHVLRNVENGWFQCRSLFFLGVTEYGISVGCFDVSLGEQVTELLERQRPNLSEENRNAISQRLRERMDVRHALHDYRACVDSASFREAHPPDGFHVERLTPEDIRDSWAKEWRTYGIRMDGRIIADGSVLDHEDTPYPISEIRRVSTSDAYRNRGLARAVVSACVMDALSRGRIPIYRASVANAPSLRVADALGFRRYCESFEVLGDVTDP